MMVKYILQRMMLSPLQLALAKADQRLMELSGVHAGITETQQRTSFKHATTLHILHLYIYYTRL